MIVTKIRTGIGYDLHRLVPDRTLLLGGVRIDYPLGLLGHSDGDVVLHAVGDALLGAAALGDIGEHFPDTDPRFKDADSKELLASVCAQVRTAGWNLVNADVIIHAERPRLTTYKDAIRESLHTILQVPVDAINVKATTNEGLGPIGRNEAIACWASVLLTSE